MESKSILRKYTKALQKKRIHIPTEAFNVLERILLNNGGEDLLEEPIDRDMLIDIEKNSDYKKKGMSIMVYNSLCSHFGTNLLNRDILYAYRKKLPLRTCGRVGRKMIEEYLKKKELID